MKSKKKKILGPGFITGAADDDPSGIATYSQAGAIFGYKQLWTALYFFPFMAIIQEMCGRIGMVTGKGLADLIGKNYIRPVLIFNVFLLVVVNVITIGADLGAIANCFELTLHIPFTVALIGTTILTLGLQIFIPYKTYTKYLKFLAFALFSYVLAALLVKQDWSHIAKATLIPTIEFDKKFIINIVAVLGTTISPYLFFWQTGQEIEEEVANKQIPEMGVGIPHITSGMIRRMRIDTTAGMFFSCLIMWFIILTAGATLHLEGITQIDTADQAAQALKPIAGDFAFILFSIGIIGTGLLAIPTLAGSSGYAVCETFRWKEGLYKKLKQAPVFYLIITLSTLTGVLINYLSIKPFQMLYYAAVLNGVCAPPLMVMIMLIANNKKIMGKRTNNLFSNIMGWLITVMMAIAAVVLLIVVVRGSNLNN